MSLAIRPEEYRLQHPASMHALFFGDQTRLRVPQPYRQQLEQQEDYRRFTRSVTFEHGLMPPPRLYGRAEDLSGSLSTKIARVWEAVRLVLAKCLSFSSRTIKDIDTCVWLRFRIKENLWWLGYSNSNYRSDIPAGVEMNYYPAHMIISELFPDANPVKTNNLLIAMGYLRIPQARDGLPDFRGPMYFIASDGHVEEIARLLDSQAPEVFYHLQKYYDAFEAHMHSFSKLRAGRSANRDLQEQAQKLKEALEPFFALPYFQQGVRA